MDAWLRGSTGWEPSLVAAEPRSWFAPNRLAALSHEK
jgi:hypothetical protein